MRTPILALKRLQLQTRSSQAVVPLVMTITMLLSLVALYELARPAYLAGILFSSRRVLVWVGLCILSIGAELAAWWLLLTSRQEVLLRGLRKLEGLFSHLKFWNLAAFGLLVGLFSYLVLGPFGAQLEILSLRVLVFWMLSLIGALLLRAAGLDRNWGLLVAASVLLAAAGYRSAVYLADVSTNPFSIGWSEASRYYYASLYFAERIYGIDTPPTVLHPSRYLLQSLAFLIPGSPLWFHRLWQSLLWIGLTGLTALSLARRLAVTDRLRRWMVAAWAFLFLLIGPVYYHLQVPLILILWGFETHPRTRAGALKSLLILILASMWAGISRVNWFPVPALLAASLYFLETPARGQPLWRYLIQPVIWGILGTAAALTAQSLYALLSGNPAGQFTSSFTSDLLWYRLFPNRTYPLGILLSSLLVILPLVWIVIDRLYGRWRSYHPIRLLGLGSVLAVLYAGGLVVSVKIGGGSNLHNLDAFLSLAAAIALYLLLDRMKEEPSAEKEHSAEDTRISPSQAEPGTEDQATPPVVPAALSVSKAYSSYGASPRAAIAIAVLLAAYFALVTGGKHTSAHMQEAELAINRLDRFVDNAAEEGPVLFIAERQLLTFGYIDNVPLVPDYERVFLMEMAMAGNPEYLGRFHDDLANHRFAMIVSDPFFKQVKGSEDVFGEENNAWVRQVSQYVLCYYEPLRMLREVQLQLLVPREQPVNCPSLTAPGG